MTALFDLALPLLRALPPEAAHRATLLSLAAGLAPRRAAADPPSLAVRLWRRNFPNPVGLAAGFDKNAEVPDAMLGFGFGFVETGTVTPRPQPGNPQPRLFRLVEDAALINRFGFNSEGLPAFAGRIRARRGSGGIVGANVGKNRETQDDIGDYVQGVSMLAPLVDYLTINVSSPNTPGLRNLQRKSTLSRLIDRVMAAREAAVSRDPPPLLLKIAPDLTPEERGDIAQVALMSGIDGLIVANATVARPPTLKSHHAHEPGGLSGPVLFQTSTALFAEMYRLTSGKLPLVGTGGISSGADAYAKIRAGASLVQLYTALVYQGPGLVERIKRDLATMLARDGFASVMAAVGTAADFLPGMSVRLLRGVGEVVPDYDGVILDLWGVVHDGNRPYPGVLDALERIKARGKPVVLLSNAPRRAEPIGERLTEIGIPPGLYGGIHSSGEEVWQHLKRRDDPFYAALGTRCHLIGPTRDEGMLDGIDVVRAASVADADFILNTGPWGWDETTEGYEAILQDAAARDLPMICANADLVVIHHGKRMICAGALAQRYEALGGRVRWHGKPFPSVYKSCLGLLGIADRKRILAIGDSLRTDIAGARGAGIDAVWIVGGIHAEELGLAPGELPDRARIEQTLAATGENPLAVAAGFSW